MSTDNLNEIWDIYDRELNKITEKRRFEKLNKGEFHLVVSAFIYNSQNQILLQKRAMNKLNYPGYWEESVGGSALKGENHIAAIQREIKEELDLDLLVHEENFYMRCIEENWIEDWFVFKTDFQISNLQLQAEEVESVKLFSFEQAILQLKDFGIQTYKR
ncbi:NUDIX domain-containing protein [Ligilactobacillus sp. WILCCON 0076]|uniref:NUDIX domain-containing protein n=1 Tax=Ligilactobacillus ubinensis TaxID=2876789 RepID=A0A9X2JN55_9LACO|nr:NUDIX domain-containing protein [Ligilactobacillus ubinensis]MCP0887356.1 NUDIX domain-containing protein [Ligilactobacillus ubinensis]